MTIPRSMVTLRVTLLPVALLAGCATAPRAVSHDEFELFRSAAQPVSVDSAPPGAPAPRAGDGASAPDDTLSGEMPALAQSPTGGQRPEHGVYPQHAGILTAYLGYRKFHDGGFWEPVDDAFSGGLEYCFRGGGSWLGFAAGVLGSYDSRSQTISGTSQSVDAWTVEGYLGPKAYLEPRELPLQLWAGLGASFVYANAEGTDGSTTLRDNDGTFGAYAQLGAAYRLNRRQSIGLEYRALFGTDVTLNGRDGDADYSQINLVFAVGF